MTKIEQQLKLYAESLQAKVDDFEKKIGSSQDRESEETEETTQNWKDRSQPLKEKSVAFQDLQGNVQIHTSQLDVLDSKSKTGSRRSFDSKACKSDQKEKEIYFLKDQMTEMYDETNKGKPRFNS